jgi:hypothetical protein
MEAKTMPELLAGIAKANITPYVGAFLAGYGNRDHGCKGVHDELYARAMVLTAGEETVALVSADLIGLSIDSVARVRSQVESVSGIAPDRVMVACTHTHSGPVMGLLRHPGQDPELQHVTERTIAGAVIAAHRQMVPAALGSGKGSCDVAVNRRERSQDGSMSIGENPEGPSDPEVGVLSVRTRDGAPLALWVTYACHPVVLDGKNYLVSADYPGETVAFLERAYPGVMAGFLTGTCGNINPRKNAATFDEVRRVASILGAEGVRVAEGIACEDDVTLAAGQSQMEGRYAALPPAAEARRIMEERTRELDEKLAQGAISKTQHESDALRNWAYDAIAEYSRPRRAKSQALEVHAFRLGDAVLMGLPGEAFVEIGLAIKAASPVPHTFVLGTTNGDVGYIPTAAAFAEGGYEVERAYQFYGICNFTPAVEKTLTDAGILLANEMASAT